MTKRKDEEFARLAFEYFLSNHGMSNQWQDGRDPPDFEVTIEGVVHPVEVAQLMETVSSGETNRSERGWSAVLSKIADEVEAVMKHRGVLRGTYCIHLDPTPEPKRVFKSVFPDIECYILDTKDMDIAHPHVLWHGEDGDSWTIEKIGSIQDMVGYTMSIGRAKWSSDIERDLRQILGLELADKRDKVGGLSDVILLLIDAYHYAHTSDWLRVASEIDFAPFHTVARVYDDWQCQVLYSVQTSWRVLANHRLHLITEKTGSR